MPSGSTTTRMLKAYKANAQPTLFLSGFFQSPRKNFHTTEKVEIDIVRSGRDVAVVIEDLSQGYRDNSADVFTNKEFTPPIFKERLPLNAFKLLDRMPGQDPFQSPNFRANATVQALEGAQKIGAKIMRSIELQASQVLQTGVITLVDSGGATLYTIDYKPKATHLVTVGTAWDAGGQTIAADIESIAEVITNDGLAEPDQLIMGVDAYNAFVADADIKARLDNRRMNQGGIEPIQKGGAGGIFRGHIDIGNFKFDIWTYGGRFTHPQTGTETQYMTPANCVVRASSGRLDATFGAIPNFNAMFGGGRSVLPELPGRMSGAGKNIDLHTNSWVTPDGEQLMVGVGSRPLMIPTAIDTFGNLATGV